MAEKKTTRQRIKDYLVITFASAVYAVAVSLFLDPNSLAPGGVTGIAIILNRLTGLETGTWVLFINLLSPFGAVTEDLLLAAVAGGCLMAVGLGLVFKSGATTGGTDIIVKLLRIRFPQLKTGFLFFVTDAVIVAASGIVFKNVDVALYAGIVIAINSLLMDVVLYGRDGAKLVFIISDKHENITKRILEELDIGVTYISGSGAYSGKEKNVIMCVMKKQISPRAEAIVREEDPLAFMIVTSATEIFGEGYKSIYSEKI